MASVRKLDPNVPKSPWIVEYTDAAGKRRRKTPKSGLKKDADAIRQKIERELDDDVHTAKSTSIKMSVLCEEFLKAQEQKVRDQRIGYSRYRVIESLLRIDVVPQLGNIYIADLTAQHVDRLFHSITARGVSARYAREKLRNLLLVERYAVRRNYTKKIVAEGVLKDLQGMPSIQIRTFKKAEVIDLLRAASLRKIGVLGLTERGQMRTECYVNIAAFCGLRFGEICGLTTGNVDIDAGVIKVRHSLTCWGKLKGPKSKAGIRDVPMPLHLRALLREWQQKFYRDNERGLLFWCLPPKGGDKVFAGRPASRKVQEPSGEWHRKGAGQWQQANFYKTWTKLLLRAAISAGTESLHFHALRHFCAAYWLENGMPITEVAKLLGHAKADVTLEIYAYAIREDSRQHEAIEKMAIPLLPPRLLLPPEATKTRHRDVSN